MPIMLYTSATNFRKNLFSMLSTTIKYNEPINISTKEGNAVVLSQEEYDGLLATLELSSDAQLKEKITDGLKTDLADCVPEDEVVW